MQDSALPLGTHQPASSAFHDPSPLIAGQPTAPLLSMGGDDASQLLPSLSQAAVSVQALPAPGGSSQAAGGLSALPSPGFCTPRPRQAFQTPQPAPAAPRRPQLGFTASPTALGGLTTCQTQPVAAAATTSEFEALVADLFASAAPEVPPGSPGLLADLLAMPPTAGITPPPQLPRPGAAPPDLGVPLAPQQATQVSLQRPQQTAAALPLPQLPPPASLQQALDMIAQQSGERPTPMQATPPALHPTAHLELPSIPNQVSNCD